MCHVQTAEARPGGRRRCSCGWIRLQQEVGLRYQVCEHHRHDEDHHLHRCVYHYLHQNRSRYITCPFSSKKEEPKGALETVKSKIKDASEAVVDKSKDAVESAKDKSKKVVESAKALVKKDKKGEDDEDD